MIDHGLHALTLEGAFSKNVKKNKENQHEDVSVREAKRVGRVLRILERAVRSLDQVDEALHAGYFFYILTSNHRFVSNSVFLYPIVLVMFAYFLPAVLDYNDHMEEEEKKKENTKNSAFRPEIVFVGIAYFAGAMFTTLPGNGFCTLEAKAQEATIDQALFIMVLVSAGILLVFNLFFFA